MEPFSATQEQERVRVQGRHRPPGERGKSHRKAGSSVVKNPYSIYIPVVEARCLWTPSPVK